MKDLVKKLDTIIIKYRDIEKNLLQHNNLDKNSLIKLNKEYAELTPLVEKINNYQNCKKNIQNLLELKNDSDSLIKNEAEKKLLLDIAKNHSEKGYDIMFESGYGGEHWLATFAIYNFSK